jgi:hypothetical protein
LLLFELTEAFEGVDLFLDCEVGLELGFFDFLDIWMMLQCKEKKIAEHVTINDNATTGPAGSGRGRCRHSSGIHVKIGIRT